MSREIQEILKKIESLSSSESFVLATVVDVQGSSYRLPGAKMLIDERGKTVGIVSGGCLEADVLERARQVLRTGMSQVFTYDTTKDESSVFSLNMGCRGVIRILLEAVNCDSVLLKTFQLTDKMRVRQLFATLIAVDSASDLNVGGRIFCSRSGLSCSDNLSQFLANLPELKNDCLALLDEDATSQTRRYETDQGIFEFAFEIIRPAISLLIFGAGADAVPLAEISSGQGWEVTVTDHRSAYLTAARFPTAHNLILYTAENLPEKIASDSRTATVVMTHNYERDREILRYLLKSPAFYVGILGPRRRTDGLLNEVNQNGSNFTAKNTEKIFAPVGLDLGADSPEAIALSIVAEIQAVLKNRAGGFLRERKGSINNRDSVVAASAA